MKTLYISAATVCTLLLSSLADASGFALGARAGTAGFGLEATQSLSSNVNARLGVNAYNYAYSTTADNIKYDAELKLQNASLLLDWHPFSGVFRFSGGLIHNRNQIDLMATPVGNTVIGGVSFTPAQIGTLTGVVRFKENVPYAGIGWGNASARNKQLGFSLDIGVIFQGSPSVELSSNGALANDASFQAELRKEEQNAEADLQEYKYYPVVSLGVSYRF